MRFDFSSPVPLYQQVADQLEAGILQDTYGPSEQVPSTTEIATVFKINPATVLKGMNLLVNEGILEKRRGLGMFVTVTGKETAHEKRKTLFLNAEVKQLIAEAQKLAITKEELLILIEEEFNDGQ